MEDHPVIGIPCPWCETEVALTLASTQACLRCDACATVVDLAPVAEGPALLPLAA